MGFTLVGLCLSVSTVTSKIWLKPDLSLFVYKKLNQKIKQKKLSKQVKVCVFIELLVKYDVGVMKCLVQKSFQIQKAKSSQFSCF